MNKSKIEICYDKVGNDGLQSVNFYDMKGNLYKVTTNPHGIRVEREFTKDDEFIHVTYLGDNEIVIH